MATRCCRARLRSVRRPAVFAALIALLLWYSPGAHSVKLHLPIPQRCRSSTPPCIQSPARVAFLLAAVPSAATNRTAQDQPASGHRRDKTRSHLHLHTSRHPIPPAAHPIPSHQSSRTSDRGATRRTHTRV
ncbi:hypothetical protein C8R47DRAFT_295246 [Mycena vitilis]|nr:hypothetical protein C8R47DRAFT_295246 [Mycena vitilis]